jgi:molecular chaperone GrpE
MNSAEPDDEVSPAPAAGAGYPAPSAAAVPAQGGHPDGLMGEATEPEPQLDPGLQMLAQRAEETRTALHDLAGRLGQVEEQLAEFHRRSAHRESVIDRLHEENQQLHGGISRAVLDPVVADLIRLYDQVDREVRRLRAEGQDERLLWSFGDDIAQILDRCGIEIYSAEPGDPFDRDRHRPLAVVACLDESWHNTVAEVVTVGFAERDSGRVRRPVQARFHQYTPGPVSP